MPKATHDDPENEIDKDSEEWKEFSKGWDATEKEVREKEPKKRKPRKGNGNGWTDGADGFVYTADGGIAKGDPANIKHAIELLGIKLRFNKFSGQTQVWGLGKTGAEFQDADACRLRIFIHEKYRFLPARQLFEDVLIDISHQNGFHPVLDYLDARTWDGVPRIDNWLISYGGAEDTPFNRAVGRIFLIAAVRRVRRPGCKFDTMLVLESSTQGRNKSQAARILATRDEWFNDNLPIGAKPQEVIEQVEGHWIFEFPELVGISNREIEHVKAFLSRQIDRARAAYGRRRQSIPRQFVAIGTTNDEEYLKNDERRFWPVRINKFDVERLHRDVGQIWAEASHYEAGGEPITLQEDLWGEAAEVRAARTFENPYESALSGYVEGRDIIRSETVFEFLNIERELRQRHGRSVGQAMRALGFARKRAGSEDKSAGIRRGDWFYERSGNDVGTNFAI
jgi:predicted P-loop ATPase